MKKNTLLIFLFAISIILVLFFKSNSYILHMLFLAFLYAGLSESWNLVGGYAGIISIGHSVFFGIGAYTSALLLVNFGISPWIGMIVGALLSLVFALSVGLILVWRLKHHFFALASVALVEIFRLMTIYSKVITRGSAGIPIPSKGGSLNFVFQSKISYVLVVLIFLIVVTTISYLIASKKIGYYLLAGKEDENAAKSLGINVVKYKTIAFAISAALVSISGTFYAQYTMFIDPEMVFNVVNSIKMALYAAIGGVATIEGPIIGALIFVPLQIIVINTLGGDFMGFDLFFIGSIFVISVLFFPEGIMGIIKRFFIVEEKVDENPLLDEKKEETDVFKKTQIVNDGRTIFSVENLNKHFGGLHAVKNLSFEVKKGEIVSIIGPNGAGKTTIFNIITGFSKEDSGIMKYEGEIINSKTPYNLCLENRIVRTFQLTKPFSHLTTLENIMVGGFSRYKNTLESRKKALEIIRFIGMKQFINTSAINLTTASRKRMEIGRALATEPKLLLLDESLAGLNAEEINEVIELIRNISDNGIDVLIIEHVMSAVMKLSDRIIVIDHGEKIAEGTPEKITNNKKVLEVYMGN